MTRTRILLDPAAAAPTGGISTAEVNLNDPAFEKLGLPAEFLTGTNPPAKTEEKPKPQAKPAEAAKPPANDEQAEAEQAEAELAARAEAAGKTVDEQRAAEAEAATAEQERLEAKAAELNLTIEEVIAKEAEEAAASAPPEMSEEQTNYVQALVADHETKVAELETAKATAEAELAAVKTQLAAAKRPPLQMLNIHPMLLANTAEEIARHDAQLANFEKWALANWDGSDAVEAKGDQPAQPAYTAEQIRARYAEIKELRGKLVPAAQQKLEQRQQQESNAKTIYPGVFDSKRPEGQAVTAMLADYPELRAIFPNFHIIAGDAFVGEKLRGVLADAKHKAHASATALLKAVPELGTLLALKPATAAAAKKFTLPAKPGAKPVAGKAPGKVPRPGAAAATPRPGSGKPAGGPSATKLHDLQKGGMSERDALTAMISDGLSGLPTLAPRNANAEQ